MGLINIRDKSYTDCYIKDKGYLFNPKSERT